MDCAQDEFMDESDFMSPITDDESRNHRVKLERSALKASEFVRSLQSAAGVRVCGRKPCARFFSRRTTDLTCTDTAKHVENCCKNM